MASEDTRIRVLDLGAGTSTATQQVWPEAEIVRVDLRPEHADVVADVRQLPQELGKFEVIYASHLLEHLPIAAVTDALEHWRGFLVEGGELHVRVPDLEWAAEKLTTGKPDPTIHVIMHIFGGQVHEHAFHQCGFTASMLRTALEMSGYRVRMLRNSIFAITFPPGSKPVPARELYAVATNG